MRNLYLLLIIAIILMIALLATVFFFFEKEKHWDLVYAIEVGGEEIGYAKVDRYKTEDRIIYKSTTFRPKELKYKIVREKTVIDKTNRVMEKFIKEYKNFGATTEATYIRNNSGAFDFLAKSGSKFGAVSYIADTDDIFIFDRESIVSYMPFVDRYNFARGGAQSFKALYHFVTLLPPVKGKIVFTSIRDEYINVIGKKIKTECLVVKAKTLPEIYIWVSKKDKSIVQLRIESESIFIKRVASSQKIAAEDYILKEESYDSGDILFPSGDIALGGTILIPHKEGKLPAVLLVAGKGSSNRKNAGLYTDISHELARDGYVVLLFDRRGIGKSQGGSMSVNITNEINDIENALKFLSNHERVDNEKVFIIAHSDACSYLPQLDFSKLPVKGLTMLGITKPSFLLDFECEHVRNRIKTMTEINRKYPEMLDSLKRETLNLVKSIKKERSFVQGRHIFVKRMEGFLSFKPLEGFKKLDIPLMIIHGRKDEFGSIPYVKDIEKALLEAELEQYSLVYFRNAGHFLGKMVDEKGRMKYYRVDKEVLETIKAWIDARCAADLTKL